MKHATHLMLDVAHGLRHPVVRAGVIAAVLAVTALLYAAVGLWWTQARDATALQDRLASTRTAIIRAQQASSVAQTYAHTVQQSAALEQQLQLAGGQADLVAAFGALARTTQVHVIAENYDSGKPHNGVEALHLSVTLQGDYGTVREWLARLTELPSWTVLEEATLTHTSDAHAPVRAQLRLATYRTGAGV